MMKQSTVCDHWLTGFKTAFLNESLDECIHMMQTEDFIAKGHEQLEYELKKSSYRLMQVSRSCNIHFDHKIKSFGFDQCLNEPCVYQRCYGSVVIFLLLYVDDILLIRNELGVLSSLRVWLWSQFGRMT